MLEDPAGLQGVKREKVVRRLVRPRLGFVFYFFLLAVFKLLFAGWEAEFPRRASLAAEIAGMVAKWQLIWGQEFEEATLDPNIWNFEIGNGHAQGIPGWGNAELQYYTDRNAFIQDGCLVIEVRAEMVRDAWGTYRYTSARMTTKKKFHIRYGRIEIRAKLPRGKGLWPALWLLGANIDQVGWPLCGEIDIMEMVGHDPRTVYGHVHGPGYSGGRSLGASYTLPPDAPGFDEAFHVFSVEWEEEEIRWYVDENLYFVFNRETLARMNREELRQMGMEWAYPQVQIYRWVFDREFFLLMNVAVGGHWPGYPHETTSFPQRMYVDYVRVYQRAGDVR